MNTNFAAVIFDCDGVLVDSEPLSNRVLAEEVTKLGWPMTAEESIRRFKGGKMTVIRLEIAEKTGHALSDDWLESYYARVKDLFRSELQAIDGVLPVLEILRACDVPFCVASQGPVPKMEVSLGVTGLWDYFEGRVFSANMVARPKPAPDLFLYAAENLQVKSGDCVVIEDSVTGVLAACSAGMTAYGFASQGEGEDLLEAGAAKIFTRMADLPLLLGLK